MRSQFVSVCCARWFARPSANSMSVTSPIFRTRMRLVVGDVFGPWKRDVENGEDGALGLG